MQTQACNLTWKQNISTLPTNHFEQKAPSLMPVETGDAVHQSTKLGLTLGENFYDPNGNNALSQAQPAVQGITLPTLQNTMAPTPFLLTAFLSLPWPTWPLPLLLTVKECQP
jgi:hypothetical protein